MIDHSPQTTFLNKLAQCDYAWMGKISGNFTTLVDECESVVKQNPTAWSNAVVGPDEFDAWDEIGQQYLDICQGFKNRGYTKEGTRCWKSTNIKPKLTMSWENSVADQLPMTQGVITPTLQPPGVIMPWHADNFMYFKRILPNEKNVARFLIFLKDWTMGHFLQVGNSVLKDWKAGDVVIWHPSRYHSAINAGFENKWTCNVTGILTEDVDRVVLTPVGSYQ